MKPIILVMMMMVAAVTGQLAGTELTMRTFDSVDIEVCVDNIIATEQAALQGVVQTQLQKMLLTTAVYFTRFYTMSGKGTACYMFVFQGRSPEAAREAVQTLLGDTSVLAVPYKAYILQCPIAAVPWRGEDVGPVGLDWELTTADLMLWGGCMGGLLLVCVIGSCCFVQLSVSKEAKRADALLAKDRRLMQRWAAVVPPASARNNNNNSGHSKQASSHVNKKAAGGGEDDEETKGGSKKKKKTATAVEDSSV